MKPLQLLVTIALVVAGILVYDTAFRGSDAPLDRMAVREVVRPRAPSPEGVREDRPALRGDFLDALPAWKAEIESRVADLEAGLPGGGASFEAGADRPPSGARPHPPASWRPEPLAEGEAPRFEPEDLAWFRALDEELLRIRREEAETRSITAQLQRIRSDLPNEMRDDVVAATRTFRAEKRDILARSRDEPLSNERRKAAFDEARRRYEEAIRRVAPVEADEIIQRFGSYPGRRLGQPFKGNR